MVSTRFRGKARCCTRFLFLGFSMVLGAEAVRAAPPNRPPNVIVILTDDQGSLDAGCYGARDLLTPNMDALAARGVRFTQFYSGAPVCSPSRAALLTGRYPPRAGVPGNVGHRPGTEGMPAAQVTLAEMFKAAGYATAHIGKWHLGSREDTIPNAQGFDYSFGHYVGCIDNWSHFFYWAGPNRHDLYRNGREVHLPGHFFPDLMVEEATQFIDRHRQEPFFIYFAANVPHYPYQGDPKWLEHYRQLPYPRNLYAAFLSTLDERLGRLFQHLEQRGLREQTIIVLQSDNGYSTEERAHFGGGWSGPYRGAKFSLFEGGIRLPAIISWPGHLPEGEVRDQMAHACDWLPTLAELCGIKILNEDIDGRSLVQVIRSAGAPSPHDVLHWQTGVGPRARWAVRSGPWKLLGYPLANNGPPLAEQDQELFLSNLEQEVSERRNLAREHPEVVRRLQRLHAEWLQSWSAPGR